MPNDRPLPPYVGPADQLILRDVLAIDRTRLANERTLLAWLRTALMLLVSGVTLIKLFDGVLAMQVLGVLLVPGSLITAAAGLLRYRRTRACIEIADRDCPPAGDALRAARGRPPALANEVVNSVGYHKGMMIGKEKTETRLARQRGPAGRC